MRWFRKFMFFYAPDGGGGGNPDPPINMEDSSDEDLDLDDSNVVGSIINSDDTSEEDVIYVNDEKEIPEEKDFSPVPPKKSIEDILEEQGKQQTAVLSDLGSYIKNSGNSNQYRQEPAKPQETEEEFQKRYSKLLFDDPVRAQREYNQRYIAPVIGQFNERDFNKDVKIAKLENKELFDKYGDEINEKIRNLSPQEKSRMGVIDEILRNIKTDHIEDFAKQLAEEMLKDKLEELQKNNNSPTSPIPASRSSSTTTYVSGGGAVRTAPSTAKKPTYRIGWIADLARREGTTYDSMYRIQKERGNV